MAFVRAASVSFQVGGHIPLWAMEVGRFKGGSELYSPWWGVWQWRLRPSREGQRERKVFGVGRQECLWACQWVGRGETSGERAEMAASLGRMERMNPEQGEGGPSLEASGDWKEGSLGVCEEGTRGPMAAWPWFYAPSSKREDWSWSSNLWPPDMKSQLHWKRPWCWKRLKAGEEGGNRGWDGLTASPTQWTWIWANSRRWWRTGKLDVLQFVGSQSWTQLSDWTTKEVGPPPKQGKTVGRVWNPKRLANPERRSFGARARTGEHRAALLNLFCSRCKQLCTIFLPQYCFTPEKSSWCTLERFSITRAF